ncbi:MAG TPA: SHOCT domain-containing protein [Nocardioidaceae bacterium]|nr:SHOCT domain-containing protein [Nocardioidaceae bacterium]
MDTPAGWLADPGGTHELRYWDGTAWTEHVSDAGESGTAPLAQVYPPPEPASPPPPPPPPSVAATADPTVEATAAPAKGGWRDRLKQAADTAVSSGKQAAAQAKTAMAEQGSKRTAAWAEDPNTLWFGESKDIGASATGVAKARYRITKDRIQVESGMLGTRSESVPLWSVKDMDVRQAAWQRGKDVGDVVLTLEDAAYAAQAADMFNPTGIADSGQSSGQSSGQFVLDNVEHPHSVVDLLMPLVSEARHKKMVERQSQYLHVNPGMAGVAMGAPAAPTPAAGPPVDLADQLRKLAELRDQGVLTPEEFEAQKARLLAG